MAAPLRPRLYDRVHWRGAVWWVTRILDRGRLELSALREPGVQGICLASQLHWHLAENAWLLVGGV